MSFRTSILAFLGLAGCAALPAGTSEYEVKAAYVYNFAKFVEWPPAEPLRRFTICVYGKDPFGGFLDEVVRGKLAHGLPVAVERLPADDPIWDRCQAVFLAVNTAARLEPVLRCLKGRSILTIGEADGFAENGGMIGLLVDRGRVRFDINLAAISAARLQASSRLIEIGRVVGTRK